MDELEQEQERAYRVMREWMRAEPDHQYLTKRQMGAREAAIMRKHNAQYKADQSPWERDKHRYNSEREKATLPPPRTGINPLPLPDR
ncbi:MULTISPECIES: hypothetical protein [unclassified Microbacterium]|uniref:hypothetical protein n=1 Tax=unclassified Microbacterium TaxID=2609290 RepID=UPI0011C3C12B|nr:MULTISPECIES: hypothetical protein [unclassified Microbacterium]MBT2486402.1 hypothetical protein [Microbacterium sp. ISL-108]